MSWSAIEGWQSNSWNLGKISENAKVLEAKKLEVEKNFGKCKILP
jgi:hypothetical protein